MATIELSGVDPFDGSYDFSFARPFTAGELHIIKEIAGVRAQELEDALSAGDADLIVAFAVIALCRVGKVRRRHISQLADTLWDAPMGSLKFIADPEDDAGPPATSASGDANESSASASGNGLSIGSENQGNAPNPTGDPGLDIGQDSARETSGG